MPRDIALFDAYVPTLLLLALGGAALTWIIDRVLAYLGIYRFFWHPALVRASLLTCVIGLLGLAVYR
jgi:protein AaeX